MSARGNNDLVDFLGHYGPKAASDAMYDELIERELEHYGIDPPILIEPPRLSELIENFGAPDADNVVLTGTAGDGKTFHCRRVWEHFGGSPQQWAEGRKVARLELPSGRTLVIVKDLSELRDEEKARIMPGLSGAVRGQGAGELYLVAANDGQLLATWREWADSKGSEEIEIFRRIEALLVQDELEDETLSLRLYNLSRMDAADHLNEIIEKIVEHPQWADCEGCPLMGADGETSCPIRINRERLRGGAVFRSRLLELLQLAAANRLHLPIRHLLLLTVNIILGDAESATTGLLTCRKAKNRANSDKYRSTNPYANVFGGNLPAARRRQYQAFAVLESFGIGQETNNAVDNLLVYDRYANTERYTALVGADAQYGGRAYERELNDYLDGERTETRKFLRALERQRQRLFFTLPEGDALNPWELTVYRSAGAFLEFCRRLDLREDITDIREPLVKGLNRIFSGMMMDETSELYIASSGGDGRGKIASVLHHQIPATPSRRKIHLDFEWPKHGAAPRLVVRDPVAGGTEAGVVGTLDLQLTHFEYLMRVARGSLPASFSRQCFEDFLDFKLRVIERLDEIEDTVGDARSIYFQAVSVNAQGRALKDEFLIRTDES